MKKFAFILIFAVALISNVKAQIKLFPLEKGVQISYTVDPVNLGNGRASLGYSFGRLNLDANYEFYKKIDFNAADISLSYKFPVFGRFFVGAGAHFGIVNNTLGLGEFLEQGVIFNRHVGLFVQEKLFSNGSIGQYAESRLGLSITL